MEKKPRVLIAKMGLDGHDRAAKVVTALLRDAGMEVIYLGSYQTADRIVHAAIEEDVDAIGLSCLCGAHLSYAEELRQRMRQHGLQDVLLLVGGVVPQEDIPRLHEVGVDGVFPAGASAESITGFIFAGVKARES